MIYPEADKLEEWGSKYALVALAAKRAKQVKAGAPILVDTQSRNPLTIALEEIAAGKVICTVEDHDIVIPTSIEPEVAELLAIPVESDLDSEEAASEEQTEDDALAAGDAVSDDLDELLVEEDEEEARPLGTEDVWTEVLAAGADVDDDTDPELAVGSGEVEVPVAEPDVAEVDPAAEKPKRGRKRAAAAEEVPVEVPDEALEIEDEEEEFVEPVSDEE